MAVVKSAVDRVRLLVLDALLKEGCLAPNLERIQKHTKLHKSTIKSSIHFLKKEGVIRGFYPDLDLKKIGFGIETTAMILADKSKPDEIEGLTKRFREDPNLYLFTDVIGSSHWNIMAKHIYKNIESYHSQTQKKYFESIPRIHELIRDQQLIYTSTAGYKEVERSKAAVSILKKEKGIE